MATGYQGNEPSSKFCEIVRIGRLQNGRHVEPPVVTIFYKYKSGRGGGKVEHLFSKFFTIYIIFHAHLKCILSTLTCLLLYKNLKSKEGRCSKKKEMGDNGGL